MSLQATHRYAIHYCNPAGYSDLVELKVIVFCINSLIVKVL